MEPQETPRNLFGGVKRVSLMMRCLRNRTSVFISFDDYQVADRIGVVWRLDDRQPTSAQWNIASDRKAAGLWDGRGAIPFLKELAGASRLVMRLSLDRSTETYTFDIAGSADEVAEVAAACNWAP
jgi:type VI secretion system VasI family protein